MKMQLFFILFYFGQIACNQPGTASKANIESSPSVVAVAVVDSISTPAASLPTPTFKLPYQLNLPVKTFKLPMSLTEISGLSCTSISNELFAVQDEIGYIYTLDKTSGEVLKKVKFWKKGDYEGIEYAGESVYVIKSTGTLYEVQNMGKENQNVVKYNTFLTRENDVEGLGFDAEKNALLIACKGLPKGEDSYEIAKMKKEIYQFDLATKKMNPEPAYVVSQEMVYDFLSKNDVGHDADKLIKYFRPGRNLTFSPSALAVHPLSKDIYILSSVKKILIVLSTEGAIRHISLLNKKVHRQPEGIAFSKDGTMFLSNEGKDGTAKIHQFRYALQ